MPPPTPVEDDRIVRPFADFLREQTGGRTHDELSEALHDLIAAVQATGKAGSLTFSLKLTPASKTDSSTLVVTDNVVVKAPSKARKESVFFVADDGNLSRNNPQQPAFDSLREVPGAETFRELDHAERAAGDR